MTLEPHYTVSEIAETLKVDIRTVRSLIAKKELRAVKVGKEYRIPESSIQEFLNRN